MTRGDLLSQIESERLSAEAAIETERTNAEPLTQPPYFVLSEETNTISFPVGLSGSLTQLADGSSYHYLMRVGLNRSVQRLWLLTLLLR